MTLLHYFFDLTSFYRLGHKYKNIFVRFLVQMKTLKFAFEIYWPLAEYKFNATSKQLWPNCGLVRNMYRNPSCLNVQSIQWFNGSKFALILQCQVWNSLTTALRFLNKKNEHLTNFVFFTKSWLTEITILVHR